MLHTCVTGAVQTGADDNASPLRLDAGSAPLRHAVIWARRDTVFCPMCVKHHETDSRRQKETRPKPGQNRLPNVCQSLMLYLPQSSASDSRKSLSTLVIFSTRFTNAAIAAFASARASDCGFTDFAGLRFAC